jgi:hypothetical protein
VFFKFTNKEWQRIPLEEFPAEIKEANLVNRYQGQASQLAAHVGVVTAEEVKKLNGTLQHEVMYQQIFVREKIKSVAEAPDLGCNEFE